MANRRNQRSGFALILVLSLMSFIFLLIVTLITYVGTELRLTELRKQKVLAGSNARMGGMVAIGELQKHLGPDTRVTATADLLDERINESQDSYTYDASPSTGVDLNEDGNIDTVPFGQRHWTGIWKHRADTKVSPRNYETGNAGHEATTYDSEFVGHPEAEVAWLVSGNEGHNNRLGLFESSGAFENFLSIPDGISRVDRTNLESGYGNAENAWQDYRQVVEARLSDYNHPLKGLPDPEDSNETVWILKHPLLKSSFDPESPELWKEHLAAEPVKVRKSFLRMTEDSPPVSSSDDSVTRTNATRARKSKRAGSYAYWVGDEGVKTKINLVNPEKESTDSEKMLDNLLVATEPNLEIETGLGMTFANTVGKRQNLNDLDDYAGFGEGLTQDEVRQNYHSLTTDSFGVLADVRTGGLKRDLSNAFMLDDLDFEDVGYANWLFQERVDYMKNFRPMDPTKMRRLFPGDPFAPMVYIQRANDWLDQADNAFIHDERVMTAGPKWSVLRDFHNIHEEIALSGAEPEITSSSSSVPRLYPDCGAFPFPRRKGDNTVIFGDTPPHSPGGFFSNMPLRVIQENYNFFSDGNRPEPLNHPISPVLVELKYSNEPYIDEDGTLCLAMFPAFALWNPYNVPIQLGAEDAYELDIKLSRVHLRGFNTKDWEIFRKWRIHGTRSRIMANSNPTQPTQPTQPTKPPPPPPPPIVDENLGQPKPLVDATGTNLQVPFIDLNGNGRKDPGEFREPPFPRAPYRSRHGGGGGGGGGFPFVEIPHWYYMFEKNFANPGDHVVESNGTVFADFRARKDFSDFPDFYPFNDFDRTPGTMRIPDFRPFGVMPEGEKRYLRYRNPANQSRHLDAPLRLTAKGVRLEPGEKAFFVPAATSDIDPRAGAKVLLMTKGTESTGHHLRFKAPPSTFRVLPSDPVTIEAWLGELRGFRRGDQEELYATQSGSPNGVILYLRQGNSRRPIKKINKEFKIRLGHGARSYAQASELMGFQNRLAANLNLGGSGFRLRWKLPGSSSNMTFHEFNPRALVDGYQDGSGDLWEMEHFPKVGGKHGGRRIAWSPKRYSTPKAGRTIDPEIDFKLNGRGGVTSSPYLRTIPREMEEVSYFGHFHRRSNQGQDNQRFSSPRVALFEVPRSPMLSLMQFRHANLNSYSHSPAYLIGNSYATPQVGRYKKWGRVRRLIFQSEAKDEREHPEYQFKRFWVKYKWAGESITFNLFPWDEANWAFNLAAIRDTNSEHNHQNITLDLSYYSNEALFDGYFLTGVAADYPEEIFPSGNTNTGERLKPFRNPRLKPYHRRGEWKRTEYGYGSADSNIQKHQTMAADLLVEGAFNVNSTSVESWVAHLAALKGHAAKIKDLKDGMTLSGNEETWQEPDVTPFLRLSAPTGAAVPAPGTPDVNNDFWTGFVTLTDRQIRLLAAKLVEEIKLRGPFLSLSDFINRRVTRMDFPQKRDGTGGNTSLVWLEKKMWPSETESTVKGLRGPVQAAIAKARLNQGGFAWSPKFPGIPEVPPARFVPNGGTFHDSSYGLHAVSLQSQHTFDSNWRNNLQSWGHGIRHDQGLTKPVTIMDPDKPKGWLNDSIRVNRTIYSEAFTYGEAPENLLSVENLATGVNMPGWLTQADVLSPLAPVLTARSDTFVIRTYGEAPTVKFAGNGPNPESAKAWCEVTVQRIPDYVKSHVDPPHHRPHEPFADENYDGIWTADEWWLDLNLNRETINHSTGKLYPKSSGLGTSPDLPGGNNAGPFKVGLSSDLKMQPDPDLEGDISSNPNFFSTKGINQRFGRKFRVVKFRWLRQDEV